MSVFLEQNHLFLRNPRGGVEDVETMVAAGFTALFCNIKDYSPEEWHVVRSRAKEYGAICGPWLRTTYADAEHGSDFEASLLTLLLHTADEWDSPLIVNSESELKGSGDDLTSYIAETCGPRDWALSMEPWPFANVDWTPIKVPVLPQIFGPAWGAKTQEVYAEWRRVGIPCVVSTFGTYDQWQPGLYERLTPYGLYTADDCGNNFQPWVPVGTRSPCVEEPPPNGGDMEKIGSQHGVTASINRLRDLDPSGTLLQKQGDKWPPLSTLTQPIGEWKAYDKLERSLTILVTDHDTVAASTGLVHPLRDQPAD